MTIKVKPLVWSPDDEEYCAGSHDNLVGICEYSIYPHPCAIGFFVLDVMGNRCDQDFPTIEDAKAAAQADYEARILSAIEVVDPATIRAEALREARQFVGCWGGEEGPDAIATPEEPYTKGFLAAIFHAQAQIDALIDKEQDR